MKSGLNAFSCNKSLCSGILWSGLGEQKVTLPLSRGLGGQSSDHFFYSLSHQRYKCRYLLRKQASQVFKRDSHSVVEDIFCVRGRGRFFPKPV